jgi:hypothetical protein
LPRRPTAAQAQGLDTLVGDPRNRIVGLCVGFAPPDPHSEPVRGRSLGLGPGIGVREWQCERGVELMHCGSVCEADGVQRRSVVQLWAVGFPDCQTAPRMQIRLAHRDCSSAAVIASTSGRLRFCPAFALGVGVGPSLVGIGAFEFSFACRVPFPEHLPPPSPWEPRCIVGAAAALSEPPSISRNAVGPLTPTLPPWFSLQRVGILAAAGCGEGFVGTACRRR